MATIQKPPAIPIGDWEEKVWGWVRHINSGPVSASILYVERGTYCSTHRHRKRYNMFVVSSGIIKVTFYSIKGTTPNLPTEYYQQILRPGCSMEVIPGIYHRFEVIESGWLAEVYRTADGTPVDLNDIERLDEGGRF